MTSPRRVGAETSKTRALLLDNTERIMLEAGYAAVSYRNVAAMSGVTAGLVQYYFPTLDELFLALLRGRTGRHLEELREELQTRSDEPLRVIWDHSNDEVPAALMLEFMALANHRKSIRAEITEVGERLRKVWLEALPAPEKGFKVPATQLPVSVMLFLLAGIPKLLLLEGAFDLALGHAETVELVEQYLERVEPRRAKGRKSKGRGRG
jgi:TetR/AcrR family transcriptional regulator, transcriptional repressor for nem operon